MTPLAGLKALQYLELSNNEIEKIDALSGLPALTSLYLTGNKIADCTPAAQADEALVACTSARTRSRTSPPWRALTKVAHARDLRQPDRRHLGRWAR